MFTVNMMAHATLSGCQYQKSSILPKIRASASPSASAGIDLKLLESAISKKDSTAVKEALDQLNEVGWAKKWSSQPYVSRRTTSLRELTTLGIKNAENLAIPSVRNDAAFLFTVVGSTGFLGLLAGQLPGDWGFFVPYLIGSISLVVLAVGSISPGLLQAAIQSFSSFYPDYQERIARHEAAHFLVAYLLGLPILGYSLDIGKEHVNLIDGRLEKLIYSGQLDAKELDSCLIPEREIQLMIAMRLKEFPNLDFSRRDARIRFNKILARDPYGILLH